jgi:hypothetical protein
MTGAVYVVCTVDVGSYLMLLLNVLLIRTWMRSSSSYSYGGFCYITDRTKEYNIRDQSYKLNSNITHYILQMYQTCVFK